MPRLDYRHCKTCGRHASEVGNLSHTRLCPECGKATMNENIEGIATHSGPAFTRWRRAMAASVGAVLLDDVQVRT
jgi:hypothetical protein